MQDKFPLFSANFGDRLRWLRKKRGLSQSVLGDGSASTASDWEKDTMPRGDRWQGIADRLGLSWNLISTGIPATEEDYDFIRENRNLLNFTGAPPGFTDRLNREMPGMLQEQLGLKQESGALPMRELLPREIPVVSWARAGEATSFDEIPKDWQRTIFTNCKQPHAFAIEVEGDSMLPDFRPGDVVVVMPEVEARNHSPVVAKLKNDGVVLKILNLTGRDGRTIRLSSVNPVYQPTDYTLDDFHWIYPVHSSQRMHWR